LTSARLHHHASKTVLASLAAIIGHAILAVRAFAKPRDGRIDPPPSPHLLSVIHTRQNQRPGSEADTGMNSHS
jgi:hypothetical protein